MKKTVALALCCALVLAPVQQARSSFVAAICLIGGGALVGGVVVYMIKTCKPKYYCVEDEDGKRFPSNATKTERIANDWKVKSGPYNSAEEAAQYCPPSTNTVANLVMMQGLHNGEDEVAIPQMTFYIERSFDLTNWVRVATLVDDPTHFSWQETNSIASMPQAFYRASY